MELVDGETLDNIAQRYDKIIGTTSGNNGVNDYRHILRLVGVVGALMEQFLDYVAEVCWQGLPDL